MGWKDIEKPVFDGLKRGAKKWVRDNVNRDPRNHLWSKSREELVEMFPGKGGLDDKSCMNTFVWQEWLKIRTGELEAVDGNERSMWYRDVEPFYIEKSLIEPQRGKRERSREILSMLSEIGGEGTSKVLGEAGVVLPEVSEELLEKLEKKDPETFARLFHGAKETYVTNLISIVLVQFVKAGVFRFHYPGPEPVEGDFKFRDPRAQFRKIGRNWPRITLYTEKEGLWWLCEYAAREHGISVVASQGESGLLAVEYIYDDLMKAEAKKLKIGAITDYDPWGALIAPNYKEKLQLPIFYGGSPGKVKLDHLDKQEKDLVRFFTLKEIERYKRDLRLYSQYKQKQVEDWVVKDKGGINGEWYGIHIDTASRDRLRKEVDRWVKKAKE